MVTSRHSMSHSGVRRKAASRRIFEAPSDVCALLQSSGTPETIPAKTILFSAGGSPQGVFLVLRGRVVLSAGDDHSPLRRIAAKGSLLGLPSTVSDQPYSLTAEALTKLEVCRIPPQQFRRMLASDPVLGMAVVNILSNEVSALRRS